MNDELDTLAFESEKKESEPEPNYKFAFQIIFVIIVSMLAGIFLRRYGIA